MNSFAKNRVALCGLLVAMVLGSMPASAHKMPAIKKSASSTKWNGEWFPNVELVNQDGKTLRFYDDLIKDKVVAINFIFTTCKDSCPLETAKLKQVYQKLGDLPGREIFFYSISIDPERDTVAELKKYTEKFEIGPGWQFLRAKKEDVDQLRIKLGLLSKRYKNEKLEDHNLNFIVGNAATGHWIRRSPMDDPNLIARLLRDDLRGFRDRQAGEVSYAEAPQLGDVSRGHTLFRTRCQSCHTIGGGDTVGPDLKGVLERRERAWLVRFMKEPDKMLGEKDPIAVGLYQKYNQVAMPNLRLGDGDIEALIQYLKEESAKNGH